MSEEEILYGTDDQESLDLDPEETIERILDDAVYKRGEKFADVACRIDWPIRIYEYRRMKISDTEIDNKAQHMLDEFLYQLDEHYQGPDWDGTESTPRMKEAARALGRIVREEYRVWSCEKTGQYTDYTEEMAKEQWGDDEETA